MKGYHMISPNACQLFHQYELDMGIWQLKMTAITRFLYRESLAKSVLLSPPL